MSRKPLVSFHVGDPHSSSLSSEGRSPLAQLSWLPLPHPPPRLPPAPPPPRLPSCLLCYFISLTL